VKYTGTYQFTDDIEKTFTWTLNVLSIVWEGFNFSGQQTLQEFYHLIRCTISTALESHYKSGFVSVTLISPKFRATFSAPLSDALIQAARNVEDMVSGGPTQIEYRPDVDNSLEEKIQVLHQAATILDQMGQALKLESEGEQVDRGEEGVKTYWHNLRTHFEVQADELEESVKRTRGTAEISH
jgi:hypothetical protein